MSKNYYINGLSPKGLELLFKFQWKLVVWWLYFMNLLTDFFGKIFFTNTSSRMLWDLVYNWLYTKYKNIEFLTLFEYHCTWELTVVWRLISCHLHQNPGKEYIYDIPYCAIHLILFENWKRFLSSFFINGRSIQRCCIVRKFEICDIFEMRNLKWFKLHFIST